MSRCDVCGKQESMPYHCRHCGGTYCGEHRLPENHECPGLEDWNDPGGVFESTFDDSVDDDSRQGKKSLAEQIGLSTGPGSVFGYFRGNMTYVILGVMWVMFFLQHVAAWVLVGTPSIGLASRFSPTWNALFVISPAHPEYVWTWVTNIFSHGGFVHIAGNSIVIYFFGRLVEDYIGSRDFTVIFLVSGVLASLGQIAIMLIQGLDVGALGASGAALAILGLLTILNPNIRVYLYFILPVPIWAITGLFAAASIAGIFGVTTPLGGGSIADGAHLFGLLVGVLYGYRVRDKMRVPDQLQFGGGPGGPGGPGGGGGGRRRGPF